MIIRDHCIPQLGEVMAILCSGLLQRSVAPYIWQNRPIVGGLAELAGPFRCSRGNSLRISRSLSLLRLHLHLHLLLLRLLQKHNPLHALPQKTRDHAQLLVAEPVLELRELLHRLLVLEDPGLQQRFHGIVLGCQALLFLEVAFRRRRRHNRGQLVGNAEGLGVQNDD